MLPSIHYITDFLFRKNEGITQREKSQESQEQKLKKKKIKRQREFQTHIHPQVWPVKFIHEGSLFQNLKGSDAVVSSESKSSKEDKKNYHIEFLLKYNIINLKDNYFYLIDITKRNLFMEKNFLYEQIKKIFPHKKFYPVDHYVLLWVPPGSYFPSIIPLNDPSLQCNVVEVLEKLKLLRIKNKYQLKLYDIYMNSKMYGEKNENLLANNLEKKLKIRKFKHSIPPINFTLALLDQTQKYLFVRPSRPLKLNDDKEKMNNEDNNENNNENNNEKKDNNDDEEEIEEVHPATLISYRTKTEVLKKLTELFMANKITINEIEQVYMSDLKVWKVVLYNLLSEEEQKYHSYLIENEEKELVTTENKKKKVQDPIILEKTMAKKYINGLITLQEYEEAVYPEIFETKQLEEATYPLPLHLQLKIARRLKHGYKEDDDDDDDDENKNSEESFDCCICLGKGIGAICCHSCSNMICVPCMRRLFHDETDDNMTGNNSTNLSAKVSEKISEKASKVDFETKLSEKLRELETKNYNKLNTKKVEKDSFLLFHHKYCLRLGTVPEIKLEPLIEDSYLREFRLHTRQTVLKKLFPNEYDKLKAEEMLLEEILDEDFFEKEKRLKREQIKNKMKEEKIEKERLDLENPKELQELSNHVNDKLLKKYNKILSSLDKMNPYLVVNLPTFTRPKHTKEYHNRLIRLRKDEILKLDNILKHLHEAEAQVASMIIPGNYKTKLVKDINSFIIDVEKRIAVESIAEIYTF